MRILLCFWFVSFLWWWWWWIKPAWPQSPSLTPWHWQPLPSSCLQPSWPCRTPAWAKSTYSFKVKGIIRSARSTLIWDCKIGLSIVLNLVQFQNILHLLSWWVVRVIFITSPFMSGTPLRRWEKSWILLSKSSFTCVQTDIVDMSCIWWTKATFACVNAKVVQIREILPPILNWVVVAPSTRCGDILVITENLIVTHVKLNLLNFSFQLMIIFKYFRFK